MDDKEIHLAQDSAQSWTLVNTLMNLSVAENVGKSVGKVSKNGTRESWLSPRVVTSMLTDVSAAFLSARSQRARGKLRSSCKRNRFLSTPTSAIMQRCHYGARKHISMSELLYGLRRDSVLA
jgi:hypothetical protein